MTQNRNRRWSGLLLEGLLIVSSILLAFWIEAAWGLGQDRAQAVQLLEATRDELEGNLEVFDRHVHGCEEGALGATLQLLELMGPSPPAILPDSLAGLLVRSFRGTPPDIRTAAFDALAASPEFAAVESLELQRGLTGWRNLTDERRRRRQISADQLVRTLTYLERAGVAGHVNVQSRVGVIPPSRFPLAVRDLLSDPVLQGIVGSMGVLKAQMCQDDVRRRGAAEDLIQLVSAELER